MCHIRHCCRMALILRCGFLAVSMGMTSAYECNITFVRGIVEVESYDMCGYISYHVIMLLFFGALCFLFMLTAVVKIVCYGSNISDDQQEEIQKFSRWALYCIPLMMGFECALALCYLIVVCFCFHRCIVYLFSWVAGCVHLFLADVTTCCSYRYQLVRRFLSFSSTSVHPATHDVEVGLDEACCICLESRGSEPWFFAPCSHSYHLKCIQNWQRGTCPLCRKTVWV